MAVNLNDLLNLTSHLRILYAEDDVILRENTVSLLSDIFQEIDEVDNGVEALKHYKEKQNGYDIIITDLNMPHMNGMELIKQIKAINAHQPIIVVTAHNETEYLLESIRHNVNGYILKPLDFDQLIETLYKVASGIKEGKEKVSSQVHLEKKWKNNPFNLNKTPKSYMNF